MYIFIYVSRESSSLGMRFVAVMLLGACLAPLLLAEPCSVVRADGSCVLFEQASCPWEELRAARRALQDSFVLRAWAAGIYLYKIVLYDISGCRGRIYVIQLYIYI